MNELLEHAEGEICRKCTGVSAHKLTCPALQLPAGYQPSKDPESEYAHWLANPDSGHAKRRVA